MSDAPHAGSVLFQMTLMSSATSMPAVINATYHVYSEPSMLLGLEASCAEDAICPLKRRALNAGHPSLPCTHQGAIEGACQKDALSTLGAIPVHELLVTPAIAAVLEGGKGEVRDRHGGNRGDDHEHRGQDVESGHDGHHPFRYKSSARHTMRTIFRSLRATGGARIACRGPHALRCEPKTGRRTRGARATHRKPDTAQGHARHAPRSAHRTKGHARHAPRSTHRTRDTPVACRGPRVYRGPARGIRAAQGHVRRDPHAAQEQTHLIAHAAGSA